MSECSNPSHSAKQKTQESQRIPGFSFVFNGFLRFVMHCYVMKTNAKLFQIT